jgi:hypothetical protein
MDVRGEAGRSVLAAGRIAAVVRIEAGARLEADMFVAAQSMNHVVQASRQTVIAVENARKPVADYCINNNICASARPLRRSTGNAAGFQ